MTEALFNTKIGNSLVWRYKIPDIGRFKKPYDGIGAFAGRPVYWEAKWIKKPAAFPWKRLEEHQIENLLALQVAIPTALCLFIIGVDYGRGDKRAYIFTDMHEIDRRKRTETSILKKEFDQRTNYIHIVNDLIDFALLPTIIEVE